MIGDWILSREFWAHFLGGMLFAGVLFAPMMLGIHAMETGGGTINAIAASLSFVGSFGAILLFGVGVDEGDSTPDLQAESDEQQPFVEWLREELSEDVQRWRSTSPRGWALTGVETVFTVGLALRAFLHLFLLGLLDEPEDVTWGLSVTPVDGVDASTVTDIRWLVAGVGLLMVSYGAGLPLVAKVVWFLQALPLLADFAISVDEDLNIGGAARLSAAASHPSTTQNHDQTHSSSD